ncbi:MAG: GAF domain-containing sensor histidine kinase [Dehalococcoidia bacterium]
MTLRFIKWTTIIVPAVFLTVFVSIPHFFFPAFLLQSVPGFFLVLVPALAATFVFSQVVFHFIAQAEEKVSRRHQELLTLNTVAAAASQPLKLEQLLGIALDNTVESLGITGGVVCILDEDRQELLHVACKSIPEHLLGPLRKVKLDQDPVAAQVVATGEPVYLHDMINDPRLSEPARQSGFRSALSLPLSSEGKVKGIMALVSRTVMTFEPSQVEFLLTLGSQLAVAIEKSQLQEKVREMAIMEERERIAREMHDGMGQVLGFVNTKSLTVKRLLDLGRVEEAQGEVAELEKAAREVYADVREGVLALRHPMTSGRDWVENLKRYIGQLNDLNTFRTEMTISGPVQSITLPQEVELQLIRIVQEALANVRKHAHASQARLDLSQVDGHLQVSIEDDGRGFDPAALSRGSHPRFGIQIMRERAESAGAQFELDSTVDQGTRISFTLPLPGAEG